MNSLSVPLGGSFSSLSRGFLLAGSCLALACGESSKEPEDKGADSVEEEPVTPPRRVVGYIPTYRSLSIHSFDFETLTHLNIAFANPTGEGSASDFEQSARALVPDLVSTAHASGVKVLAAIAGGTKESGDLVAAQTAPENVDAYVAGLVDLVTRYGLDGIDNDIEGDAVDENYESFVRKLRAALPESALLTAAVATKNGAPVPKATLEIYDFINIMAYDHCSWSDAPCDQAGMVGVEEDLRYWVEERKVPRHKAVLGVPFYGWCWGCAESQSALTYSQILSRYPEQALTEDWIEAEGETISFNSPPTIKAKAKLGQEYGGVMIWELGQDASGKDALFAVIRDAQ